MKKKLENAGKPTKLNLLKRGRIRLSAVAAEI